MKIEPMTEQAAKAASAPPVLQDGDYDCEVAVAVEKNSQSSGMGMFEIDLKVYLPDGKTRTVRDYVMTEGKAAWRLRQCCTAFGALPQYEAGEISAYDLEGRSARVTLRTEAGSGEYGPKNRVKTYLAPAAASSARKPIARQPVPATADLDDDIPF